MLLHPPGPLTNAQTAFRFPFHHAGFGGDENRRQIRELIAEAEGLEFMSALRSDPILGATYHLLEGLGFLLLELWRRVIQLPHE